MKKIGCAVLWAMLVSTPSSFGQAADGNLVGTVVDASGGAVANADVELANVATGVKSTTKTDEMAAIGSVTSWSDPMTSL